VEEQFLQRDILVVGLVETWYSRCELWVSLLFVAAYVCYLAHVSICRFE
jgi:hypothetical protein